MVTVMLRIVLFISLERATIANPLQFICILHYSTFILYCIINESNVTIYQSISYVSYTQCSSCEYFEIHLLKVQVKE